MKYYHQGKIKLNLYITATLGHWRKEYALRNRLWTKLDKDKEIVASREKIFRKIEKTVFTQLRGLICREWFKAFW